MSQVLILVIIVTLAVLLQLCRPVSRKVSLPLYRGEFGAEIDRAIPHAYALYHEGRLETIQFMRGMAPFYESIFDRSVLTPVDDVARTFNPKNDYWYALFRGNVFGKVTFPWKPPPYRWRIPRWQPDVHRRVSRLFTRPLLIIHNKYTREWGDPPINFIPMRWMRLLYRELSARYDVIVIHPQRPYRGYTGDHQMSTCDEHFDYGANRIRTLDDIMLECSVDFNTLQLIVHSQCQRFVSIQGGTSRLASLFGGTNVVLHRRGAEVRFNEYKRLISRMSDVNVVVVHTIADLVSASKQQFMS